MSVYARRRITHTRETRFRLDSNRDLPQKTPETPVRACVPGASRMSGAMSLARSLSLFRALMRNISIHTHTQIFTRPPTSFAARACMFLGPENVARTRANSRARMRCAKRE